MLCSAQTGVNSILGTSSDSLGMLSEVHVQSSLHLSALSGADANTVFSIVAVGVGAAERLQPSAEPAQH
jgi:hypothetical protein